jgi:hypothetical protein
MAAAIASVKAERAAAKPITIKVFSNTLVQIRL